jgi:3-deoxy-manno-octulosonate cytidylyltransferase (CMP-KDO synthetase)
MKTWGIIPCRMASSRFPNKPLAKIHGVPMAGHVYFRSKMSKLLDKLFIATCDDAIYEYARSIDAPCIMTSKSHERAVDRSAEAAEKIEQMTGEKADIIVMIQGDEPMLVPEMIDAAIKSMLEDPSVNVVNLMGKLIDLEEFDDPNEVKVVTDLKGDAVYFSREPIPSRRKGVTDVPMNKQVCIMPFRTNYLRKFLRMPQTPLEIIESVDMMRIIEHGEKVRMVPSHWETWSVDTAADLKWASQQMINDPLRKLYSK